MRNQVVFGFGTVTGAVTFLFVFILPILLYVPTLMTWEAEEEGRPWWYSYGMVVVTALTNLCTLPVLMLLIRRKKYLESFAGIFTLVASFMYHYCDSVDHAVFLEEINWHRLDNVGALLCFTVLFTFLMHNENETLDTIINYVEFSLHLILQEKAPWYEPYTLGPVTFAFSRPFLKMLITRKVNPYKPKQLYQGSILLAIGGFCFYKGLDDANDFLRIWHGLWHAFVAMGTFFLWQALPVQGEKPGTNTTLFSLLPAPAKVKS